MNKAIIFDKDGTLIQLDAVWYKIVHRVLDDIFQTYPNEKVNEMITYRLLV